MSLTLMLSIAFAISGTLILAALAFGCFRVIERTAATVLIQAYAEFAVRDTPLSGDVVVRYDTYHGCLVTLTHTRHYFALPPAEARRLLARLLRFNLTFGLLAYGVVLVPIVALMNYVLQRRSIAQQQSAMEHNAALLNQPLASTNPNPYAPSATIAPVVIPRRQIDPPPHPPSFILWAGGMLLMLVCITGLLMVPAVAVVQHSVEPLAGLIGAGIMLAVGWGLWRKG